MNLLEVKKLSFSYDKKQIFTDFSFRLNLGEIVGLVGPNGSGKTTLIKNVMNLLEPQSGFILIDALSHRLPAVQKKMMYLASEDYLPEFLTGEEYIRLLHTLYRVAINESLLQKLLAYYNMSIAYKQMIEQYSHGMKRKMQLICAFLIQPKLLIIDETLNGLGLEARVVTKKLLPQYVAKGNGVLLCTHDFSLIEELQARAILIHKGTIQYDSKEYLKNGLLLRDIFYDKIKKEDQHYELD